MPRYLLSFYQPEGPVPPPEVLGRIMRELDTINNEIKAAGSWVFGPGRPNNGGCFMLLNLAVGGDGPGGAPPPSARFPVTMLVDYLRVWR